MDKKNIKNVNVPGDEEEQNGINKHRQKSVRNPRTEIVREKLMFKSADEKEILRYFYTPVSNMVSPLLHMKLASIISSSPL